MPSRDCLNGVVILALEPSNIPIAAAHAGPASAPQAQPGNASAALQKLQAAAKLINEALPNLPMGTEFHTDVLKIATMVNKALEKAPAANPQSQVANLVQLAKQTAQGAPMDALSRLYPQPNGPAMPGAGAPPPMPGAGAAA